MSNKKAFHRAENLCEAVQKDDVDENFRCLLDKGHDGQHTWTDASTVPQPEGATPIVIKWETELLCEEIEETDLEAKHPCVLPKHHDGKHHALSEEGWVSEDVSGEIAQEIEKMEEGNAET